MIWLACLAVLGVPPSPQQTPTAARPIILAHYMPWFEAKPAEHRWGWHWTMNKLDPGHETNGLPDIASHFHPLIGTYDSDDPAVIEYHLLLMKLAGIDGVVIDWYGVSDLFDYPPISRNTAAIIAAAS